MYKRTEKAENKEQNKKVKLFIQVLKLNILETDLEKIKIKPKKEADEVVYLGTRPRHLRDRFRETKLKIKNGADNKAGKKVI